MTGKTRAAAVALVAIAVIRMASTFTTFSQTTDEAMHVGGGLEVLQDHTYQLMVLNPPLPRIVMALPQYIAGVRLPPGDFGMRMHGVFYNQLGYKTNLALARSGNMLFFILAAMSVWILTRRVLDEFAALIAILFFTTQPIVLGYSALATHEASAVASLGVALIAFLDWLERPDSRRALLLGLAYGFGILCKFSGILYVPAVCAAILLTRWVIDRTRPSIRQLLMMAAIVLVSSALLVWIGYGFNIRPFLTGVSEIARIDREGMMSYAMGRWTSRGWWWYFPFALLLKTTLPFLALFVAGFVWKPRRVFIEFAAASIAILMVASRSRLDIGVRYVLPVFVPMTIAVAAATMSMKRVVVYSLIALHLIASIAAHPDYFPYFNLIAGRDPSRFLIDSNLDWEQDALRLRHVVRELKIESLMVRGLSAIDYDRLGFPHVERYDSPFTTLHGWVAIGDSYYREGLSQYGWPQIRGRPYRRVGKSIRLYYIAELERRP